MDSPKATCSECGIEFLQTTADSNGGVCRKCRPGSDGGKLGALDRSEIFAGNIELSMRLLLAFFFGSVFCGLGYVAGAWIWSGIGLLLALIMFPIGFVYGFFVVEINALIRFAFRCLLKYHWG